MTLSNIIARRMADEEEFSIEITKVLDSLAERGFNRLLRDEQKSSLRQLLRGRDLLAVLPTGFGKSLIFQALAMARELACVLVICLLKSIVEDQILEVSSKGLSADSLPSRRSRAASSNYYLFCIGGDSGDFIDKLSRSELTQP